MRCGLNHHKTRYPSQPDAERVAEKRMRAEVGLGLRVYKCPTCLGWHLTKRMLSTAAKEITQ